MRILLSTAAGVAAIECRVYPLWVALPAVGAWLLCIAAMWRSRPSKLSLAYNGTGNWQVQDHRRTVTGTLGTGVYRSGLLLVLPLRTAEGRTHRFAIWRDAISEVGFSYLQLYLMTHRPPTVPVMSAFTRRSSDSGEQDR